VNRAVTESGQVPKNGWRPPEDKSRSSWCPPRHAQQGQPRESGKGRIWPQEALICQLGRGYRPPPFPFPFHGKQEEEMQEVRGEDEGRGRSTKGERREGRPW